MPQGPRRKTLEELRQIPRALDGAEGKAELYRRELENRRREARNEIVHEIGGLIGNADSRARMLTVDWDDLSLNKAQLQAAKAQLADIDDAREHRRAIEQAMLGLVKLTEVSIEQDAARHEEAATASDREFRQNLRWTRAAVVVGMLGIPIGAVVTLLAA